MALGRLHDPERTWLKRVAGEKAKRLGRIGKAGERDNCANCARLFHRRQRADLASQRAIAADDGNAGEQRGQVLGELMLESGAIGVA